MNKLYSLVLLFILCPLLATPSQAAGKKAKAPLYKDATAPIEERVNDLLGRMTLEEKVMQLNQFFIGENDNANNHGDAIKEVPATLGSLIYGGTSPEFRNQVQKHAVEDSRLGIPMIFGYDIIHGFRTIMPIPLAQACSWNPALVEEACRAAAQEGKMSGIDWTFSPMIDTSRDPRWGRIAESYGEDPYTNGVFAQAAVRGYQGKNLNDPLSIAACLKHYVGYGASEAGRDYVYSEISRPSLWNIYLLPYEMGVKAGARTLMSSFNDISGVPGSANHYTLTDVLRGKWGFTGFVVSDWDAVKQLINQGLAKDLKDAGRLALNAGVDMDMMSHSYDKYLQELLQEGKVDSTVINEAVKRVLRVKFELGLFEHPYTAKNAAKDRYLRPSSLQTASELAAESMVLLKNDGTLPLTNAKKIAVVGPIADDGFDLIGTWSAHGDSADTRKFIDGIKEEFGKNAEIRYTKGCALTGDDKSGFAEARELAKWADVVIYCAGESKWWSGENASRANISLPQIQQDLMKELKANAKKVVLVLSTGRPVIIDNIAGLPNAILETWHPGTNGASAMAGILSGRINPSGRLAVTFPLNQGQIPIYYDRHHPARNGDQGRYHDSSSEPLYSFGDGLSYTEYKYGDISSSATTVKANGKLNLEIPVTNVGNRDGKETVFWYINDPYNSITRPMKELKHFEKKEIKAGATETFAFDVDVKNDFGYYDGDGNKSIEPGDIYVIVKDKKIKIDVTE